VPPAEIGEVTAAPFGWFYGNTSKDVLEYLLQDNLIRQAGWQSGVRRRSWRNGALRYFEEQFPIACPSPSFLPSFTFLPSSTFFRPPPFLSCQECDDGHKHAGHKYFEGYWHANRDVGHSQKTTAKVVVK
jgi:hypothetical protein